MVKAMARMAIVVAIVKIVEVGIMVVIKKSVVREVHVNVEAGMTEGEIVNVAVGMAIVVAIVKIVEV